jgi:hypothetical protein
MLDSPLQSTARGAVTLERLAEDATGDLVYTCARPWFDGTTGITLSPLALLEKLASVRPPIGPACVRQASFGWVA